MDIIVLVNLLKWKSLYIQRCLKKKFASFKSVMLHVYETNFGCHTACLKTCWINHIIPYFHCLILCCLFFRLCILSICTLFVIYIYHFLTPASQYSQLTIPVFVQWYCLSFHTYCVLLNSLMLLILIIYYNFFGNIKFIKIKWFAYELLQNIM